jgi:hypothetical protein
MLVTEWTALHGGELLANWEHAAAKSHWNRSIPCPKIQRMEQL